MLRNSVAPHMGQVWRGGFGGMGTRFNRLGRHTLSSNWVDGWSLLVGWWLAVVVGSIGYARGPTKARRMIRVRERPRETTRVPRGAARNRPRKSMKVLWTKRDLCFGSRRTAGLDPHARSFGSQAIHRSPSMARGPQGRQPMRLDLHTAFLTMRPKVD